MDVRKDQEESDPVQLWPAPGLSQSTESLPPSTPPHVLTPPPSEVLGPAIATTKPGQPTLQWREKGRVTGLHSLSSTCPAYNPGAWAPQPTWLWCFRVFPRPVQRYWGARAPQQVDIQAAATHTNPCLQVCTRSTSAHMPLQNCVLPSLGPRHTCARRQARAQRPTDRHPKIGGRPGAGGGPAAESGQPPPRGDPASLGCGQRVSQVVARKPQGRPVPAGRVQGPAAPRRPPPPSSTPAVHVSRTSREAQRVGLRSFPPALRRGPAEAPERC